LGSKTKHRSGFSKTLRITDLGAGRGEGERPKKTSGRKNVLFHVKVEHGVQAPKKIMKGVEKVDLR